MLEAIKEIKSSHVSQALVGFSGTLGPGLLVTFHFWPNLATSLDIIRLCLLSLAITCPLVTLNTAVVMYHNCDSETEISESITIGLGAVATCAIFYVPLFAAYHTGLSFKHFSLIVVALELTFIFIINRIFRNEKEA